ncbi:alpha/beta hydrolase [Skermanella pratensis]|uniref:alpha/beta hydrolase n=1 Tax=Skermanella pratensis TaxID=2233999 RepID=UPI0013017ED2|nr:phospholipase [Skermanella pratensis]
MSRRIIHRDTPAGRGRLTARAGTDCDRAETPPGIRTLSVGTERFGLISVPPGYRPGRPYPLLVLLHGAGGEAGQAIGWLRPVADEAGLILLAPQSEGSTWDVIMGGYGPDVKRIDDALAEVFRRFAIDPDRVAVGGFSDGASYALSLGLTNGGLFRRVAAFSPGFAAPAGTDDSPGFYISHGTGDTVLPIDACSRRLVPRLRDAGFDVLYREFDGGHTVPPCIAREAVGWLLDDTP